MRHLICLYLCLLSIGIACKREVNERRKGNDASIPGIKKDSVRFIRDANGTAGTLSFEATVPSLCELRFWSTVAAIPPAEEKAVVVGCPGNASINVSIPVAPLSTQSTYAFSLRLWSQGMSKENGRTVRINEKGGSADIPTPKDTETIAELAVARIIVPLNSAEIHSHKLPKPSTATELRSALTRPIGCNKALDEKPLYPPEGDNPLKFVSLDGFARANASVHPAYTNRMLAHFDAVQEKLGIDWSYQWQDKQYEFSSQPPGFLESFRLVSKETTRIREKDFSAPFKSIPVVSTSDLSFEWLPKNASASSYMIIQMIQTGTTDMVECRFPGAAGSGKVPPEILQKMANGTYKILAVFESNQVIYRDSGPSWIIRSHDWRYADLTKV